MRRSGRCRFIFSAIVARVSLSAHCGALGHLFCAPQRKAKITSGRARERWLAEWEIKPRGSSRPTRKTGALKDAARPAQRERHRRLSPWAGLLVATTGYAIFDPMIAAAIAMWLMVTTGREVFASHDELIWPEKIVCGHPGHHI